MNLLRSFDDIYDELLTAHFNKSGQSAGTFLQIVYSSVAVVAWGLYRFGNYVAAQIFPDTADSINLERHAKTRGINKLPGETDAELLERYIDDVQYPRAGGNKYDWPRWAREASYTDLSGSTESVKSVLTDENRRGDGTINIVITSDSEALEEVPSTELIAAVGSHLEGLRPLGIWDYQVIGASHADVDIDISISADNFEEVQSEIESQLIAYLKSLLPGQTLTLAMINAIAIDSGATDVIIAAPVTNVTPPSGPLSYGRIWPGVISISEIT